MLNVKKYRRKYYLKNKKRIDEKREEYRKSHLENYKRYYTKVLDRDCGLYRRYKNAKWRCNANSGKHYKYYKSKGIKFEWKCYADFKKDMYKSYVKHIKKWGKKNTSIDRINGVGNYCKENCRWATWKVQNKNRHFNKKSS